MVKSPGLVALALALSLPACAGGDSTPAAPGFRQLNEAVFKPNCASAACHSGAGIAGLSFDDAEAAYAYLVDGIPVNAPAAEKGLRLVAPGDPEGSFLVTKMTANKTDLVLHRFGAPMPMAATEIPGPSSLQAIRDWIAAGAPLDGGPVSADLQAPADGYIECEGETEEAMRACFGDAPDPSVALRLFTKPMVVPAGQEVQICNYLDVTTTEELFFKEIRGAQFRGGHHAAVFSSIAPKADLPSEPCGDDMADLRFVGGAGGSGIQFASFPPASPSTSAPTTSS